MNLHKISTKIALLTLSVTALSVGAHASDSALRVHALCSGTHTHELISQQGDQVTVQFLPSRALGFDGSAITYERIARPDAQELGFELAPGTVVYMLHGDEELPAEYVILPEHLTSQRFKARYGKCSEEGRYDPERSFSLNCSLLSRSEDP